MTRLKTIFTLVLLTCLFSIQTGAQNIQLLENVKIKTNIFEIEYSQKYQQPLSVKYRVQCPTGDEEREGLSFKKYPGIITSDDIDYANNIWDKGHMAPAGAFTCDIVKLTETFSYLNCALQHESLNRGPWKELEHFEKDLTKVYTSVVIEIKVYFENKPEYWLKSGALVPVGFGKTIICDGKVFEFYFPNKDVSGHDWIEYKTN